MSCQFYGDENFWIERLFAINLKLIGQMKLGDVVCGKKSDRITDVLRGKKKKFNEHFWLRREFFFGQEVWL